MLDATRNSWGPWYATVHYTVRYTLHYTFMYIPSLLIQ